MFKRIMISMVAVGLVTIFIAETANALVSRRRRTVRNFYRIPKFLIYAMAPHQLRTHYTG